MTLPPIADDDTLRVRGARGHGPELHAGVYQPEDEQEAAYGPENDADYCSWCWAAVDAAVGGGDYPGSGLADGEECAFRY